MATQRKKLLLLGIVSLFAGMILIVLLILALSAGDVIDIDFTNNSAEQMDDKDENDDEDTDTDDANDEGEDDSGPLTLKSAQGVVIYVDEPSERTDVSCPINIEGRAPGTWYFEANFPISVVDSTGKVLATGFATAQGEWMTEDYVKFTSQIACPNCSGTVKVVLHKDNPSDLRENDDSVSFELGLAETCNDSNQNETMSVKVFFNNTKLDPNLSDCGKVYSSSRSIAKTSAVATAAVNELLKGPSEAEKGQGFLTNIPAGTKLNSLNIRDKTAYADFNVTLGDYGGGSCKVTAIRAQITETIKQFSSVEKVVISINGKTEDILQP